MAYQNEMKIKKKHGKKKTGVDLDDQPSKIGKKKE